MRPDSRFRRQHFFLVSALTALVAALALGGTVSAVSAKQPKLPSLYKGNGYRIKPGLLYGWDGSGGPVRYLGKTHISDAPGSTVKWTTWNRQRAVGVGLARSSGCSMGGKPGKCEVGYPWNGTNLQVVAWRPKNGHFTRMKMKTRIPRSSSQFYELVLAFKGPLAPDSFVAWKTVRTTQG